MHESLPHRAGKRLVQAAGFACLFVSRTLPLPVAAIMLLALVQMASGPLVQTIVTELAPRTARAT
jgi:hypothetical protein